MRGRRDAVDRRASGDDRALVERARRGDRAAYDALVRLHFPRIYGIAFRLVGNHEDAEDLAQDCFVRAYERLALYRADGAFEGWLVRIVVHLVQDRFRRRGRAPRVEPLVPGGDAARSARSAERGGGAELERRELHRVLIDGLRRLPERLRVPLVLRTLEGLEYADVADATGVTPNTARTQVMKARRALMRLVAPFFGDGLGDRGGER